MMTQIFEDLEKEENVTRGKSTYVPSKSIMSVNGNDMLNDTDLDFKKNSEYRINITQDDLDDRETSHQATPESMRVQHLFNFEFDKKELVRLQGKQRGLKALADIASFPPMITSHFNEDGTNLFRSKIQICIFLPSLLVMFVVILICILPNMYNVVVKTEVEFR